MEQADYALLAQIAPTVAQSAEFETGGVPWQQQTLTTGRALGRQQRAKELVAGVEQRFVQAIEQSLDAVREGRVIYWGEFSTPFAGALGYSSPLSLAFAIEHAVPRLAAALDGDPATTPG